MISPKITRIIEQEVARAFNRREKLEKSATKVKEKIASVFLSALNLPDDVNQYNRNNTALAGVVMNLAKKAADGEYTNEQFQDSFEETLKKELEFTYESPKGGKVSILNTANDKTRQVKLEVPKVEIKGSKINLQLTAGFVRKGSIFGKKTYNLSVALPPLKLGKLKINSSIVKTGDASKPKLSSISNTSANVQAQLGALGFEWNTNVANNVASALHKATIKIGRDFDLGAFKIGVDASYSRAFGKGSGKKSNKTLSANVGLNL